MRLLNKRKVIFLAVCLILTAGLYLGFFRPESKQPVGDGSTGLYVDPLSHETVSSPIGKAPDIYGSTANLPLYLGFSKLYDHGISDQQLSGLKTAFYNYSQKQATPIKEISIDVDHITSQYNPASNDTHFYILFNGTFDRKTAYKAKAQYSGLNDIRLLLTDSSGKATFDSGVITAGE